MEVVLAVVVAVAAVVSLAVVAFAENGMLLLTIELAIITALIITKNSMIHYPFSSCTLARRNKRK
eukprot:9682546-Ditylum_brightwellii.AAC.1